MAELKKRKKEEKKATIAHLGVVADNLEKKCKKVKTLKIQLSRKTDDISKRMLAYTARCTADTEREYIMKFFVLQWFRSFLTIKDEAMVLYKGCITRQYHYAEHADFIHSRGKQASYYRDSDTLSCCSVDGWRFEYNVFKEKFSESQTLESFADRCDLVSDSLEEVCDALDGTATILLQSLKSYPLNCFRASAEVSNRANKHNAEHIELQLTAESKLISLGRKQALCSRVSGLSTVVEDPQGWELARGKEPPPLDAMQPSGNSRSISQKNVIIDNEDLLHKLQQQRLQEQRREQDLQVKASMEQFKRNGGFQGEMSLDAIKYSCGATNLVSDHKKVAETRGDAAIGGEALPESAPPDTSADMKVEDEDVPEAATRWLGNARQVIYGPSKTVHAPNATAAATPQQNRVEVSVAIPLPLQSSFGASSIKIHIELSWGDLKALIGEKSKKTKVVVPVDHLIAEIHFRLWARRVAGVQTPLPLLVTSLRTGTQVYPFGCSHTITLQSGCGESKDLVYSATHGPELIVAECAHQGFALRFLENIANSITQKASTRDTETKAMVRSSGLDLDKRNAICVSVWEAYEQSAASLLEKVALNALPEVPSLSLLLRTSQALEAYAANKGDSIKTLKLDLQGLGQIGSHTQQTLEYIFCEISRLRLLHSDTTGSTGMEVYICCDRSILNGRLLANVLSVADYVSAEACGLRPATLNECLKCLSEDGVGNSRQLERKGPDQAEGSKILSSTKIGEKHHSLAVKPLPIKTLSLARNPMAVSGVLVNFLFCICVNARSLKDLDLSHCASSCGLQPSDCHQEKGSLVLEKAVRSVLESRAHGSTCPGTDAPEHEFVLPALRRIAARGLSNGIGLLRCNSLERLARAAGTELDVQATSMCL